MRCRLPGRFGLDSLFLRSWSNIAWSGMVDIQRCSAAPFHYKHCLVPGRLPVDEWLRSPQDPFYVHYGDHSRLCSTTVEFTLLVHLVRPPGEMIYKLLWDQGCWIWWRWRQLLVCTDFQIQLRGESSSNVFEGHRTLPMAQTTLAWWLHKCFEVTICPITDGTVCN